MIAQISGCLLIMTALSLLKFRPQYDRIISILLTFAFFAAFYFLAVAINAGVSGSFSLLWDSSPAGDVKLEIISSPQTYMMILPYFAITGMALFNNLFFKYEIHKKNFTALLLFNLFCLIMLVCGNNFIQMITFVFVIDIISQLFIKNVEAGRNYALYNLAADMALFGVLAVLSGRLDNLSINHIRDYYQPEQHGDFVALLLMTGLFIKFGFGFYHMYLADLKNVRFHRLILIPYFSSPAAALLLFVKLHPLLTASPLFSYVLNAALALAFAYGIFGVITQQNLKEKTIFLNLMILAFLLKQIERVGFDWGPHFAWLIVLGFAFNLSIYYLHYYAGRNTCDSFTGKPTQAGKKRLVVIGGLWLAILAAYSAKTAVLPSADNALWTGTFSLLLGLAAAELFNRVSGCEHQMPEAEMQADVSPYPALVMLFIIAGIALYQQNSQWLFALWQALVFVFFLFRNPFKKLRKPVSAKGKEVIVPASPACLTKFSRKLSAIAEIAGMPWFLLTGISSVVVAMFRKFDRLGFVRYFVLILGGIVIFVWCFGV